MSWKPEVFIKSENKWCSNALIFTTKEEAEANASDLLMRWMIPVDSRAVESTEEVNYSYINRRLEPVKS